MTRQAYLQVEELLAEAQRIAGAEDWGDEAFHEPFRRFVGALNAEADLTPEGVARTKSHVMKMLVGRLRLFKDRKCYPAIAQEKIRAPLFITGHGRSGTSYLNALLASDRRNFAPLHWQIWTLSPPPNHPSTDNRTQIEVGAHYIAREGWQDPDVRSKHDYSNAAAAEDTLIQAYSFISKSIPFFWNAPSFGRWLAVADYAPAYRIERQVLQALQYGLKRDQWVLKSPLHIGQLGYLFDEFPDARIIVNHRDPVKSLASTVGLLHAHRKQFGNAPVEFGRDFMLASMESAAATAQDMIRRRKDPDVDNRFVDVKYLDLESDPLGQVAKAYDHHGIEFTDTAKSAMARYVAENRKGKFGAHRYDIRDLGIRVDELRERFEFYYQEYDIPFED
jgi:hypothetical protein